MIRRIKNNYYRNHREEGRIYVRTMARVIRKEIAEYRSSRWNNFLSSIQESQGKSNSACWKRLPRIYRPASMPFNKLSVGNKQLTASREITEELFQHYKKSFTLPVADPDDKHEKR
jgi:hypothetical protein